MGIKTNLTLNKIKSLSKELSNFISIHESIDGLSDTTYILKDKNGKKVIAKLYESASFQEVREERKLLNSLYPFLKVPKPLFDIYEYNSKPITFYTYIHGHSIDASIHDNMDAILDEIGSFLGKFHTISKDLTTTNREYFSKKSLENMLKNSPEIFKKRYEYIKDISLKKDGIIHGDLFLDNAKFIDRKLSGVFDFTEATCGSFIFDLAVVANSWCFYNLDPLLNSYNKTSPQKIYKKDLIEMMKFSALFYALQRYQALDKRDYHEYLNKFDKLLKYPNHPKTHHS